MSADTKVRPVRPRRLVGLVHSDLLALAVSATVATWVAFTFLRAPVTIDTVAVTNPTEYDIAIHVRGSEGGWMPMSTAHRNTTTTVANVIDQGDTWTFRFEAQGHHAGELRIERDALEAAGWTIAVPDNAEAALHDAGTSPPP
jgi:hypothetical protein